MVETNVQDLKTEQEIFDYVCQHLAKQKKRAGELTASGFFCKYRTKDGLACAVGCLLTDKEAVGVVEDERAVDQDLPERLIPCIKLLINLQKAHDMSTRVDSLVGSLHSIADKHGLETAYIELIEEWEGTHTR